MLASSNGSTPINAVQPCALSAPTPCRRRMAMVPSAIMQADPSISSSASGAFNTAGSKPSTSTPAKLSAIAAPVRQPKRSPSIHQASSDAIGT